MPGKHPHCRFSPRNSITMTKEKMEWRNVQPCPFAWYHRTSRIFLALLDRKTFARELPQFTRKVVSQIQSGWLLYGSKAKCKSHLPSASSEILFNWVGEWKKEITVLTQVMVGQTISNPCLWPLFRRLWKPNTFPCIFHCSTRLSVSFLIIHRAFIRSLTKVGQNGNNLEWVECVHGLVPAADISEFPCYLLLKVHGNK